ncbi:invasion associated locus B family protein [Sneathiella limimaris]|uniref:invasion associated locus B family protein n=1 Tax=Sneathiella limimaris TaxID=1964213 RepID=UPI00146C9042|nr:invasion associated locus B family protein [Sneathiella limimaris]
MTWFPTLRSQFYTIRPLVCTLLLVPCALKAEENADAWKLVCQAKDDPQSCLIEQKLVLRQQKEEGTGQVGQILNIKIFYVGKESRKPYIVMQLPLGVDLQAGLLMKIDENQEVKAPYSICSKIGCEMRSLLPTDMLAKMKAGTAMKVGFRPYGSKQTIVVQASLIGFTRSFSWLN